MATSSHPPAASTADAFDQSHQGRMRSAVVEQIYHAAFGADYPIIAAEAQVTGDMGGHYTAMARVFLADLPGLRYILVAARCPLPAARCPLPAARRIPRITPASPAGTDPHKAATPPETARRHTQISEPASTSTRQGSEFQAGC